MSTTGTSSPQKVTVRDLSEMKARGEKIAVLTAYDFLFARLVDESGADIVLVGDSLGQVVLGYDSTLPVTIDEMIHHARAVRRGVKRAMLVVDMPFMTFQISAEETLRNAGRMLKETDASREDRGRRLTRLPTACVRSFAPAFRSWVTSV